MLVRAQGEQRGMADRDHSEPRDYIRLNPVAALGLVGADVGAAEGAVEEPGGAGTPRKGSACH